MALKVIISNHSRMVVTPSLNSGTGLNSAGKPALKAVAIVNTNSRKPNFGFKK